jgi:hypothetical protein
LRNNVYLTQLDFGTNGPSSLNGKLRKQPSAAHNNGPPQNRRQGANVEYRRGNMTTARHYGPKRISFLRVRSLRNRRGYEDSIYHRVLPPDRNFRTSLPPSLPTPRGPGSCTPSVADRNLRRAQESIESAVHRLVAAVVHAKSARDNDANRKMHLQTSARCEMYLQEISKKWEIRYSVARAGRQIGESEKR